jgi:acid phosphatase type 7
LRHCRVLAGSAALVLTAVLSGCTTTTTSTAVPGDARTGAAEPTVSPGQINGPSAAQTGGASVGRSCLVAAAGDVAGADDWRTGAARTAHLIIARKPSRVLALGDLAYDRGSVNDFRRYYRPTWGAFKTKTLAIPGNHEYESSRGPVGFARSFGASSMRNRAVDLCHGWRVVLLNEYSGSEDVDSGAVRRAAAFLAADARRHPGKKLIAAWHVPRYSSGDEHGDDSTLAPLWRAAVRARVRIVLNAHDHHYERFAPVGPGHTIELISGLGGHHMRGLRDHPARGSTVRFTRTPAVLFLSLGTHGYSWAERTVTGRVVDRGVES